ncbi:tRNA (adenine(22)-N(1))-methyltransferase [Pseudomonas coleopterorum]|uniref:tRNA (Adenine(22)-N(1))-methyltransferase TrmK n=1 Tax=Pseudomonas coleopterorum TaxID=1605838 RepID=A0AAJ6LX25_9PSED|nr:tRNA (adenine(22)-N(1))-methyltransferase TrmK [Pseudomonas coleopterorum]WNC08583.1 tRNA (adenine(22)-N(1))-methyltransferase TrmK [Pseudomonas coleopterorum]
MNPHSLSHRLERVAAQVPVGAHLADIGSDHAYLPVALVLRGVIPQAVAGEVAQTPFLAARRSVRGSGLEHCISVRQADGLAAIQACDRITAVSLCGMGGETIRDILQAGRAHLTRGERLILQPNGGECDLRQWLMDNGYRIRHEEVLRENRFDYEIIVADHGEAVTYSPQELFFGPLQLRQRTPAFLAKWQRLLHLKRRTLERLAHARQGGLDAKRLELARHIQWIESLNPL